VDFFFNRKVLHSMFSLLNGFLFLTQTCLPGVRGHKGYHKGTQRLEEVTPWRDPTLNNRCECRAMPWHGHDEVADFDEKGAFLSSRPLRLLCVLCG
jgi:hypothetical protein